MRILCTTCRIRSRECMYSCHVRTALLTLACVHSTSARRQPLRAARQEPIAWMRVCLRPRAAAAGSDASRAANHSSRRAALLFVTWARKEERPVRRDETHQCSSAVASRARWRFPQLSRASRVSAAALRHRSIWRCSPFAISAARYRRISSAALVRAVQLLRASFSARRVGSKTAVARRWSRSRSTSVIVFSAHVVSAARSPLCRSARTARRCPALRARVECHSVHALITRPPRHSRIATLTRRWARERMLAANTQVL